jgi:hypothetical protein
MFSTYVSGYPDSRFSHSARIQDLIIAPSLTLSCSDPNSLCTQSDSADYADPDGSSNISCALISPPNNSVNSVSPSFCPCFYNQVATRDLCSRMTVDAGNIRGGTMLSIVSTVVSITDQKVSGCKNARDLAISDFNAAATNADNYSVRVSLEWAGNSLT